MKVSLIITTYNWKEALKLSLESVLVQSRLPDEIIVADDGSSDETGEMVEGLAREFPVPLIHSWQEDKGFRAARSRNLAIAHATGKYIILIDGDMVLHPDFVKDHLRFARENSFVQGSRVLIREQKTMTTLANALKGFSIFTAGLENRKNCLRFRLLARLLFWRNKKKAGIRTCNFAFWKKDAVAINGFNEDFVGWGREDSEFAIRLMNNGVWRRDLRFQAVAYHLYHRNESRTRLLANDVLLEKALEEKSSWCVNGLTGHKV